MVSKRNLVIVTITLLGLLAFFTIGPSAKAAGTVEEDQWTHYNAVVTAYVITGVTRSGAWTTLGRTVACPYSWTKQGLWIEIEGIGVRKCEDTGRYDYLEGLPHIDVYVGNLQEANRWGYRRVSIWVQHSPSIQSQQVNSQTVPTATVASNPVNAPNSHSSSTRKLRITIISNLLAN
jgi:3D (Asp-Asp-Asp) domain-containing protein